VFARSRVVPVFTPRGGCRAIWNFMGRGRLEKLFRIRFSRQQCLHFGAQARIINARLIKKRAPRCRVAQVPGGIEQRFFLWPCFCHVASPSPAERDPARRDFRGCIFSRTNTTGIRKFTRTTSISNLHLDVSKQPCFRISPLAFDRAFRHTQIFRHFLIRQSAKKFQHHNARFFGIMGF
jgi:hypothetical protein